MSTFRAVSWNYSSSITVSNDMKPRTFANASILITSALLFALCKQLCRLLLAIITMQIMNTVIKLN